MAEVVEDTHAPKDIVFLSSPVFQPPVRPLIAICFHKTRFATSAGVKRAIVKVTQRYSILSSTPPLLSEVSVVNQLRHIDCALHPTGYCSKT